MKTPGKTPDPTPGTAHGKTPGETPSETPGQTPSETAMKPSADSPEKRSAPWLLLVVALAAGGAWLALGGRPTGAPTPPPAAREGITAQQQPEPPAPPLAALPGAAAAPAPSHAGGAGTLSEPPPPPAAEVLAMVAAPTGATPDRALWDAARRLQAEPTLADDLAALAVAPGTVPRGRALAVDLLAQAGHPQAQRALVRALQDPGLARRVPAEARSMLLQRVGMVSDPLPEVVALAERLATSADPVERRAALAAAGGLARRLADRGDVASAEALLDRAVRPAAGDDVADAVARTLGLGNGGRQVDLPAVLAAAADGRAPLRRAAARGLAAHPGAQVTQALGRLAVDPDPGVQRAALQSLAARPSLPAAVLVPLAQAVGEGQLAQINHGLLVNAVGHHTSQPEARRVLEAVLRAADDDAGLRGRIRSLLRR